MKLIACLGGLLLTVCTALAASSVSPWTPIFRGIDQATGTNEASATGTLSVNALRIDLQDPDIRLFTTPAITNNYIPNSRETLLQTPREFLVEHRLQVAVNSLGFFPPGYFNPSGTPAYLFGLSMSEGRIVSEQNNGTDASAAMLFTTNNQASFIYSNWPPVSVEGIFTAVAGMYPLLSNGVNISYAYTNNLIEIHRPQPRTAFGLSQDNRYLVLMTIDGRQDFSDGAYDWETAEFLQLFGAWNAMNLDGGGSTCLVKADDCGDPTEINHNSFQIAVNQPGTQRPVGCNFGVYAKPVPSVVQNLAVSPGTTTALLTWLTEQQTTTQVEYGLTKNLGSTTALDTRPVRHHAATLTGLLPGTNYYFRAVSTIGPDRFAAGCRLGTTNAISRKPVFSVTNSWRYTSNNLDGINWKAAAYDDAGWLGSGPGLLYIETNNAVAPRNTLLPPGIVPVGTLIPRTYYFRTHFSYTGPTNSLSLIFTNYIDDGAVFYLNGVEVQRLRMPAFPTQILNSTAASSQPCINTSQAGEAATICPDVFSLSGGALTNLIQGDNVLAVEVHNQGSGPDLVFGTSLTESRPGIVIPEIGIFQEDQFATLFWNGEGFRLQENTNLSTATWIDLPGPVTSSPTTVTNGVSTFFRLRQ